VATGKVTDVSKGLAAPPSSGFMQYKNCRRQQHPQKCW